MIKNNDDHFKCEASEALQIYQLVAIFVQTMLPANTCALQVTSFLALCDVMDLLVAIKSGKVDHALLRACILKHLRAFKIAYGDHGWLPKHHLAIHLADQLNEFKLILSLLTHERKHKVVKRWSRDRFGKISFERGLMEELTLEHIHALKSEWCATGLLNPGTPRKAMLEAMQDMYPHCAQFQTARVVRTPNGELTQAGDMAFALIEGAMVLVQVHFHISVDEELKTCVNALEPAPCATDAQTGTATYRDRNNTLMISGDMLVASVTFLQTDDVVTAILPAFLRL